MSEQRLSKHECEEKVFICDYEESVKGVLMKRVLKLFGVIVCVVLFPLIMDKVVFGNELPSNIDNETWAGFLGGYIGGIATLLAVFITIKDNNTKLEEQKKKMDEENKEQRRLSIKPYIDMRYNFCDETVEVGDNGRIFYMSGKHVDYVGFKLTEVERQIIKTNLRSCNYECIKYVLRNIGAGSAVNAKININGFNEKIAMAKGEMLNCIMVVNLKSETRMPIKITFDYWDTESRGHYCLNEEIELVIDKKESDNKIVPKSRDENRLS